MLSQSGECIGLQHVSICYPLDQLPACGFQVGSNQLVGSPQPILGVGSSSFPQPVILIVCGPRSIFSEVHSLELQVQTAGL